MGIRLAVILAAMSIGYVGGCDGAEGSDVKPGPRETSASQPAATSEVDQELQARIDSLISQLKWSQPVGSAHTPFLQIPANDSAKELIKIGKPAIGSLMKALTQIDRTSPLLAKKHVVAVAILGEIGDVSAVPPILDALKRNEHDIYFIRAAVRTLGKLGDPRALPQLKALAALSFQVGSAARDPKTGLLPEGTSEDVRWWVEKAGLAGVDMAITGTDCYDAIARIDPKMAVELSSRSLLSANDAELLAAVAGLAQAVETNDTYRDQAVMLLKEQLSARKDDELKRSMVEAALGEMHKEKPTSGPAGNTQPAAGGK